MKYGFTEDQVLDMALDRYDIYTRASMEVDLIERRQFTMDTTASIGGAFSKGGIKEYLKTALSGE